MDKVEVVALFTLLLIGVEPKIYLNDKDTGPLKYTTHVTTNTITKIEDKKASIVQQRLPIKRNNIII